MRRRTAGWVVAAASVLVPPDRRTVWLEEWRAELWHEAGREGWGVRAALGSVRDALEVRRLAAAGPHRATHGAEEPLTTTLREGMTTMMTDVKLAIRSLLRAPGFTAVAVLTLALGMGGATAIYTLLDRVVLDPLPYPESDRLVRLRNQVPGVGPNEEWQLATGQYVFYNDAATTVDTVGVWRTDGVNIETPSGPQRARSVLASVEMMGLLGARTRLGRVITADDDRRGAARVALLSESFWTRSWGGDPDVIGRTLSMGGEPVEIVGVLDGDLAPPAEAGAPAGQAPDVWLPIQIDPAGPHWNSHVYRGLARLAPGATPADVERELASLMPRLPDLFPQAYGQAFFDRYGFRQIAVPVKADVVGDMARNLWILLGAVGLVLLIACANVANLFLARMEERRRELQVRSALGASRLAIARYLLSESAVLGVAGGVLAVAVTGWGLPALIAAAPDTLPRAARGGIDAGSIGFAAGLSLAVALVLAAIPLLRREGNLGALRESGRGGGASVGRQRLRSGLVVAQVAMALTLAVGAGLLLESMRRLGDLDPGFRPDGAITADLHLTATDYPDEASVWAVYDEILERVRAIPGVTAAGLTIDLPLSGAYGCTVQGFEDRDVYQRLEDAGMTSCAGQQITAPGYFEAAGIPLLEGRAFTDADNDDPSRGVAVVSRAYAERFWPGEDPIGRGIAPNGMAGPFYRVVGVVGDVQGESLTDEPAVVVHYPVRPIPDTRFGLYALRDMALVVRTEMDEPMSVFPTVRGAIREIDPSIPLANARELNEVVEASMGRVAFVSLLLEVAAAMALLLAAVGLYGVISYLVSRRTREIGVRMAMGAEPGQVLRQTVGESFSLALLGLLVGVALALGTTRVLENLLYGVEPTHPGAFAGAAALLGGVAIVAAWLPARRAARVDPAEALRAE